MSNKIENENINEEKIFDEDLEFKDEEKTELVVEKKQNLLSKVVSGVKKHGKKIAVGTAVAAVGIIGYALLKRSGGSDTDFEYDLDTIIDLDPIDVTDSYKEVE